MLIDGWAQPAEEAVAVQTRLQEMDDWFSNPETWGPGGVTSIYWQNAEKPQDMGAMNQLTIPVEMHLDTYIEQRQTIENELLMLQQTVTKAPVDMDNTLFERQANDVDDWIKEYEESQPETEIRLIEFASLMDKLWQIDVQLNNIAVDRSFTITGNVITDGVPQERAIGGSIWPGQTYLVGEQGPELINPLSAGYVIPNHMLRQAGSANAAQYTFHVNIDARGANPQVTRRAVEDGIVTAARRIGLHGR